MIIIGEKINATNKRVSGAIVNKDAAFIQKLARQQSDAGASYIDVNAGTGQGAEQEIASLKWAIDTVQSVTDLPLCLDSSDPQALLAAMAHYQGPKAMINWNPSGVWQQSAKYHWWPWLWEREVYPAVWRSVYPQQT
jgi:5-methyltetrahydrofolate corrinoid/iron sulfur protein methyltransferase